MEQIQLKIVDIAEAYKVAQAQVKYFHRQLNSLKEDVERYFELQERVFQKKRYSREDYREFLNLQDKLKNMNNY